MAGKGKPRPNYGSKRIVRGEYVYLWRPNHPLAPPSEGYVAEHRLVLYEAGIEIPKGSHIHHKNENRQDNRLENLQVLTGSQHRIAHRTVRNQYGIWPVKVNLSNEERDKRVNWSRRSYVRRAASTSATE